MKIFFDDLNGRTELTPDVLAASIKMETLEDGAEKYYVLIKFVDGSEMGYDCPTKKSSENFIRSMIHEMSIGRNIMFVV